MTVVAAAVVVIVVAVVASPTLPVHRCRLSGRVENSCSTCES